MKKSFSLYEIIFSLVILSIILYTSVSLINILAHKNEKDKHLFNTQIQIESFRLFLQHKINNNNMTNLEEIVYKDENLYYKNNLLLKDILTYTQERTLTHIRINICVNKHNTICQEVILHKEKLANN